MREIIHLYMPFQIVHVQGNVMQESLCGAHQIVYNYKTNS